MLVQLSLAFNIDFWTMATESGLIPKDAPEKPKASRQPHPLEMIPRKKVEDLTFDELELISEFIDFIRWRRRARPGHRPSPEAKQRARPITPAPQGANKASIGDPSKYIGGATAGQQHRIDRVT
jgi:hypothetical protein